MKQILVIAIILTQLSCGLCRDELKQEVNSPDGRYVAAVFRRNCGTTTPSISHVNLRETSGRFITNSDGVITQDQIYTVKGQSEIKVSWPSDSSLLIETLGGQSVLGKKESWNGITIYYK